MKLLLDRLMGPSGQIDVLLLITVDLTLALTGCRGAMNKVQIWCLREACQYCVYIAGRERIPNDRIAVLDRG
jgi:hypothetical protein